MKNVFTLLGAMKAAQHANRTKIILALNTTGLTFLQYLKRKNLILHYTRRENNIYEIFLKRGVYGFLFKEIIAHSNTKKICLSHKALQTSTQYSPFARIILLTPFGFMEFREALLNRTGGTPVCTIKLL